MRFHIVTPSFNQLGFLKRCVASVRDQVAPEAQRSAVSSQRSATLSSDLCSLSSGTESTIQVHHHVQDACSTDGTVEFLKEFQIEVGGQKPEVSLPNAQSLEPNASFSGYTFTYESVPDNGMYDALNKGAAFAGTGHQALGTRLQASGTRDKGSSKSSAIQNPMPNAQRLRHDSVVAWLNCDEQYLPGTLEVVGEYFDRHPEVDILFGDYLMVDEGGTLLSFRKGGTPRLWYIQASHLNNLSCALFFRAGVFQALGGFDATYKAVADEDFIVRALKAGFKAGHVSRYFSIFTYTGNNLGGGDVGREEFAALKKETPFLLKLFAIPLNLSRWFEKWLGGTYSQKFPIEYEIYLDDTDRRTRLVSSKVGWQWPEDRMSEDR